MIALRHPMPDETPLSASEIKHGIAHHLIRETWTNTDIDARSASGSDEELTSLPDGSKASSETLQSSAVAVLRLSSGVTFAINGRKATGVRPTTGAGTLEHIKGRCRIDEDSGCWIWVGAMNVSGPAIYAWHPRKKRMLTQVGRRAVYHAVHGRSIPNGWRVWGTCGEHRCLNPDHAKAGDNEAYGKWLVKEQWFQGSEARAIANRKSGAARRKLTDEQARMVMLSDVAGYRLADELGVHKSTISKYRRGERATVAAAGMFSGLIR